MSGKDAISLDVAVVGGGPVGLSTCLELSKSTNMNIAIFESGSELGGMPRMCHIGFGMRDQKRFHKGPQYAKKLDKLIRKTDVKIYTDATVVKIDPGISGKTHGVDVLTKEGMKSFESRFVILATGCCEASREARQIPGTRPAGIFSTGALQQIVNAHGLKPGNRAVIIGSERIAFSSVLTLRHCGTEIVGMVEEDEAIHSYPIVAKMMSLFFHFPIYKGSPVKAILGGRRVEGVELGRKESGDPFILKCDTVIVTGKFRPISTLIDNTTIEKDQATGGPIVDPNLMTSVPNIFAAGNVLRGADMNDLCALEGRCVAQHILRTLNTSELEKKQYITIKGQYPIRYVVPQKIVAKKIKRPLLSWLAPGVSIQLEHTLKRPILEGWSGDNRIWEQSFSKLLGNNRIPLPIGKFKWEQVDPSKEIILRVKKGHFH